jgi:hypothetical protein
VLRLKTWCRDLRVLEDAASSLWFESASKRTCLLGKTHEGEIYFC